MEQELTCINCPLGCRMTADVRDGEVVRVTGNSCKRGETYARQECVRPMRTLTASAPVAGSRCPVSVKTSCPIPRERIDDCMKEILSHRYALPIETGQVLIRDLLGTGADVVATRALKAEEP